MDLQWRLNYSTDLNALLYSLESSTNFSTYCTNMHSTCWKELEVALLCRHSVTARLSLSSQQHILLMLTAINLSLWTIRVYFCMSVWVNPNYLDTSASSFRLCVYEYCCHPTNRESICHKLWTFCQSHHSNSFKVPLQCPQSKISFISGVSTALPL